MASTLRLKIVTPEGLAYDESVSYVAFPGDGQLGIYPNHVPLVSTITAGEVQVRTSSGENYLAVGRGVATVSSDAVTLLVDSALTDDKIDEQEAEKAVARAKEALAANDLPDEEAEATKALLERSIAQIQFKRRRRGV